MTISSSSFKSLSKSAARSERACCRVILIDPRGRESISRHHVIAPVTTCSAGTTSSTNPAAAASAGESRRPRTPRRSAWRTPTSRRKAKGMSRPAENIPGLPESTSARTPSCWAALSDLVSAEIKSGESAFAGGRFRRSSRTSPCSICNTTACWGAWESGIQQLQYSSNALAKYVGGRNQTGHEITISGEVVKMPRMHQDRKFPQNLDCQFFIGPRDWNAHHSIPAAFNIKALAGTLLCQLAVQFFEIYTQAIEQHRLDMLALLQQNRCGQLQRSVHGKEGIGD